MGRRKKELAGIKFGMLKVLNSYRREHYKCGTNIHWLTRCDCGAVLEVLSSKLISGDSISCGCSSTRLKAIAHTIHNKSKTAEYASWNAMIARCYNQNTKGFNRYGGRGIKVCSRWKEFELFLLDMGLKPKGHSIDRINNNGNYEPENCKWATTTEQARHRKGVVLDEDSVSAIKTMLKYLVPRKVIATKLDVSVSAVSHIAQNNRWADISCLPV